MDTSLIVSHAAEAWRKYVSIGAINSTLLRPHVLESWVRAHDQGASAWVARAEVLSPAATEHLRRQHERLLDAAVPYMHLLSDAAGTERHAMMLGTRDGIVLDVVGDEQSVSGPERVPGPGSLLSEAACGSNGIGTPLAEGHYVELVSTEHFIHGFHPFTCHGTPIVSLEGETLGVLSASVRRPETAERLREILFCSAHGIPYQLARLKLQDCVRQIVQAGEPNEATASSLRRMLEELGGLPQTPAEGAGKSLVGEMMELLQAAEATTQRLERHEQAWQELAADDLASAGPVEITRDVSSLLALLETETRARQVDVAADVDSTEPIVVLADQRRGRRVIFRLLLRALTIAEGGGGLAVELAADRPRSSCTLIVRATPPPHSLGERTSWSIAFPLAGRSMSH